MPKAKKTTRTAESAPPISKDLLRQLYGDLEAAVVAVGCDGSRRLTEAWLAQHQIASTPVLRWLAERGGYCDCEVLLNALTDFHGGK